MEMNITMLKEDLQREKKDRATDVHEKEREKLQATERLRKDMLYKIKETKANLLALNDEQLHTVYIYINYSLIDNQTRYITESPANNRIRVPIQTNRKIIIQE